MAETSDSAPPTPELSALVIPLLKGVLYQEGDPVLWRALLDLQPRVRDYLAVLGLELTLDEAEGFAFLRSRESGDESPDDATQPRLPRLFARRPLSFPVSLMLALLRKRMAQADAGGADTRLILTRDEVVELVRVFLPDASNEVRLIDQIDTHLNRIIDLGFLRRLKPAGSGAGAQGAVFEVRRILKAFVDAQWLAEFDARLAAYQAHLSGEAPAVVATARAAGARVGGAASHAAEAGDD